MKIRVWGANSWPAAHAYHAHFVPDDEATRISILPRVSGWNAAGIPQYEISNFARPDSNRDTPEILDAAALSGFGVDAHSMLVSATAEQDAVRFACPIRWSNTLRKPLCSGPRFRLKRHWRRVSFLAEANAGTGSARTVSDFGEEAVGISKRGF